MTVGVGKLVLLGILLGKALVVDGSFGTTRTGNGISMGTPPRRNALSVTTISPGALSTGTVPCKLGPPGLSRTSLTKSDTGSVDIMAMKLLNPGKYGPTGILKDCPGVISGVAMPVPVGPGGAVVKLGLGPTAKPNVVAKGVPSGSFPLMAIEMRPGSSSTGGTPLMLGAPPKVPSFIQSEGGSDEMDRPVTSGIGRKGAKRMAKGRPGVTVGVGKLVPIGPGRDKDVGRDVADGLNLGGATTTAKSLV